MTDIRNDQIQFDIQRQSESISDQAGRKMTVLFEERGQNIADTHVCHLRQVHEISLSMDILPFRYLRNQRALSTIDQLKFCQACVAVVGAGGLGGYAADLLARMGLGKLILIDPDIFTESNLNRQRFALKETLNQSKVDAAANLLQSINPAVETLSIREKLTAENGERLLAGTAVAVDALDNIPDRLTLQTVCENIRIPLVHGAIAGFEGQVATILPGQTGLKNLYEDGQSASPAPEFLLGVPAITPMMIAGLQVMEVIKILLNRGSLLSETMAYLDLESGNLEKFRFGGQ